MEKIASFTVDHNKLNRGMYISRVDGEVVTYDIRTRKPNVEEVMENGAIHTLEHLFATFVRNSKFKDNIIYFGPMGCRTGFYLLTRDLPKKTVMDTLKKVLKDIIDYTGEVFGASEEECGNYRELELESAKKICREYLHTLNNYSGIDADFEYPQ